ncbi:MAG: hypothetical protein JST50_13715 [Bacteroidetes bacterium]|jgi:hypothetical protein|nr:hypothetical protein [Bacteroidota bacterium]
MNLIKLSFVSALFFGLSISIHAQNVKPEFKKFLMVSYTPYDKGSEKLVRIENIREIDSAGILHAINNLYEKDRDTLSIKGRMLDTSYRVPDKVILSLNKVFAIGSFPSHPIKYKPLPKGIGFSGPFTFFSYIDGANKVHNFIYATRFDFDDNINNALGNMWYLTFGGAIQPNKVYSNTVLEAIIQKCHPMFAYRIKTM